MEMILKLTHGDESMVQVWIPGKKYILAGVMHEDCFPIEFIAKLRKENCCELTVSVTLAE